MPLKKPQNIYNAKPKCHNTNTHNKIRRLSPVVPRPDELVPPDRHSVVDSSIFFNWCSVDQLHCYYGRHKFVCLFLTLYRGY